MRLLVTGAGGFLGSVVTRQALQRGHRVRAMVHRADDRARPELAGAEVIVADLTAPETFSELLDGIEVIVHCAAAVSSQAPDERRSRAINVEGTRRLFLAARGARVQRWIQISTMSAHPEVRSVYGRTKLAADEFLRAETNGDPVWTILRPSLIYGSGGAGLVGKTVEWLRRLPVLPLVGSGRELLRPVFVQDVAVAALDCLACERTFRQTYMIGGMDEVTMNDFMSRLAGACGHPRRLVHLPVSLGYAIAWLGQCLLKRPPLTVDNILGLRAAERVDIAAAQRDWGFAPRSLDAGLRETFHPQGSI